MKPIWMLAGSAFVERMNGLRHAPVLRTTLIVAVLTGIVKLGGVVKELIVTRYFGLSAELDAFNMALALPMFLVTVFAGPFQSVLVPAYIQEKQAMGSEAAHRLLGAVFVRTIVVFFMLTVVLILASPYLLSLIAVGFDAPKLLLTRKLFLILSPVFVLSGGVFILTAVLNAENVFAYPAITPLVSPLVVILLLVVLGRRTEALAGGVAIGLTVEVALLALLVRMRGICSISGEWPGTSQYHLLVKQYGWLVGGAFLMRATELVDAIMASTLPTGSLAALGVGTKFISFPLTLAVTALGTAILPYASQLVAMRRWNDIRKALLRSVMAIFALTSPIVITLYMFSEPLVKLVFYRGEFSLADVLLLADVLSKFAIQIPFYIGVVLMVRMIAAIQDNVVIVWISGLNLLCKIIFNYLFIGQWGVAGLALSTSFVYVIAFFVLWFFYQRQLNRLASATLNRPLGF